jgi:hypothetical protein
MGERVAFEELSANEFRFGPNAIFRDAPAMGLRYELAEREKLEVREVAKLPCCKPSPRLDQRIRAHGVNRALSEFRPSLRMLVSACQ